MAFRRCANLGGGGGVGNVGGVGGVGNGVGRVSSQKQMWVKEQLLLPFVGLSPGFRDLEQVTVPRPWLAPGVEGGRWEGARQHSASK